MQVALSSTLVTKLAAQDPSVQTAGDAVACFGMSVLATSARLIRRQDAEVSSFQRLTRQSTFMLSCSITHMMAIFFPYQDVQTYAAYWSLATGVWTSVCHL